MQKVLKRIKNVFTGQLEKELIQVKKERDFHELGLKVFKCNLKTSLKERIVFCKKVIDNADVDNEMMRGLISAGVADYIDKDKWITKKQCFEAVLRRVEDL